MPLTGRQQNPVEGTLPGRVKALDCERGSARRNAGCPRSVSQGTKSLISQKTAPQMGSGPVGNDPRSLIRREPGA